MTKKFEIRCWHIQSAPKKDDDCSTSCIIHCDNQWKARTLNEAKQIRTTHIACNENHIVKIYDYEGSEIELEIDAV